MGAEQLHRVVLGAGGAVASHEVYLQGAAAGIGRERTGDFKGQTANFIGRPPIAMGAVPVRRPKTGSIE